MKRALIIILFAFLIFNLLLAYPVKPGEFDNILSHRNGNGNLRSDRIVPDWEWQVPPQALVENYADYFQSLNETPVAVQPGEDGGVYIVYRVKDSQNVSEIYYSYIDNTGEVLLTESLGYTGYYPDAHVDTEIGDVFACWHGPLDNTTGNYLLYDLYHQNGEPGNWKDDEILVIDADIWQNFFPDEENSLLFPQVKTGPSPEPEMRRVYLVANNQNPSTGTVDLPSENVLLCYADFDEDDLSAQSDLEWNYTTIPQLDGFHNEDPYWARPIKSWTVIDNQVIFMGYLERGDDCDQMFCLVNNNYGEGEWQDYSQDWDYEEENPVYYLPGSPEPHYLFGDNEVRQIIIHSSHFNLVPTHDNERVTWTGAMGIVLGINENYYYDPLAFMIYPKTFSFDLVTEEFKLTDVYPPGANPNDDIPMKPWDLDEDGEIDEFDENGYPLWAEDWPIFYWNPDGAFHNNQYYLTTNEESGLMAYIWVDGKNAAGAEAEIAGYEGWEDTPELAICYSDNSGESWYEPIFMNANPESENYCPELEGMIPCFAYPGDRIEMIGDNAIIHLFFLDDNSYGSYHGGNDGENIGSTCEYAAIRIPPVLSDNVNEIIPELIITQNYPNPFNPSTTIEFEIQEAGKVKIDIFNTKGQKVADLVDKEYIAGKHQVNWQAGYLPSGVYYYRIESESSAVSRKVLLLK